MACNPPFKRGHGGFCKCNCKCLAPECWGLIKVRFKCDETIRPSPAEIEIGCENFYSQYKKNEIKTQGCTVGDVYYGEWSECRDSACEGCFREREKCTCIDPNERPVPAVNGTGYGPEYDCVKEYEECAPGACDQQEIGCCIEGTCTAVSTCAECVSQGGECYSNLSVCVDNCEPPYYTTTTTYAPKICFACIYTAIGGTCMPIPIPFGVCSDYGYYDTYEECQSACEQITTTSPPSKCTINVEIKTTGCCLEYEGETIYAVGSGSVSALVTSTEGDCRCYDFITLINGSPGPRPVEDGEKIEITPNSNYCDCKVEKKDPSDGPKGCKSSPSALILKNKETKKVKLLIKRKIKL